MAEEEEEEQLELEVEDIKDNLEDSKSIFPEQNENIFFDQESKDFMQGSSRVFKVQEIGVVTEQNLKDIAHELGLIKLCWADVPVIHYDERLYYPITYMKHSKKEKLLLWYSENFRQQFALKYPNRRPLLIACDNECGVQKMVSTTLRPTNMKFPEFQTWQGCANFIAEYLTYEELQSPTLLPDYLNSPQTVLKRQAGHCFEYSTLLASLLIASSYDAFVVSGYASRETCRKDQSRVECPFLQDEPEIEKDEQALEDEKYFLRKPIELKSKFFEYMEAREIQKEINARKAQELAELEAIREYERPPPDDLWTWRLHSWVVVLPSKDVSEAFFIESTTGIAKCIDDPNYHGIESIWNHQNYWVLVQFEGKTNTCKDILFELNNPVYWERLLIGEPINYREQPQEILEADTEEFSKACIEAEKHLDMPSSWVDTLQLSHAEYERRYPRARRIVHYRKALSEQFASYSQTDGLINRVTHYDDYGCENPIEVREGYSFRNDHMYFSRKILADNSVLEKFGRGREDALKERFYYSMDSGIEVKFTLLFYSQARLDGLSKWIMDPLFMTLHFEDRRDFLYYIHAEFAERTNQDQPLRAITWLGWIMFCGKAYKLVLSVTDLKSIYGSEHQINKITEKYHRNPQKDADKDVAMVEYYYIEKKILMKFHYESEHVTQANRIFLEPDVEEGARMTFDSSQTSGYLTKAHVPPPKPLYLYQLQIEYFKNKENAKNRIRERENELLFLLRLRAQELAASRLLISEFDVQRNEHAKQAFQEREQEMKEAMEREMTMVCDFLSPYYAKLGIKPKMVLTAKTALSVIEECLKDWKNLLVSRANEIQRLFEQTCEDLQDRDNWYEKNLSTLAKEQEEEYFEYCKKNSYYLHILEIRLNRLKEMAPQKYLAVQTYLKNDPRVALAYKTKHKRRH